MSLTYSNVLNINKKNYNGVTIEEKALSGKINIRGKSSDKEFMKNIGSVLNLVLPIEPNVRIFNNNISIMWLGPNEWLVETPENEKDEIISLLESKLNPEKTAITDVSFNKTVLRLEGEKVFILLSKLKNSWRKSIPFEKMIFFAFVLFSNSLLTEISIGKPKLVLCLIISIKIFISLKVILNPCPANG